MNKNGTVMHKMEFLDLLPNFILSLETLKAHSVHNDEGKMGNSLKSSNSK